jgi:hypothetical protein
LTRTTRFLTLIAALAGMAFAAPAANAGPLVASATNCETQTVAKEFLPWLDPMDYTVVPNGTLEGGSAGWTLSGASVVAGNEPWNINAAGDSKSLEIPSGASATTNSICVGLLHPTLRFFAKSAGGSVLGSATSVLSVEVLFEDAAGNVRSLPIGFVTPGSRWGPTLPYPVVANLLPLLPDERTAVKFRFRAVGGATWQIDDVYVDPRARA